MTRIVVVPIGDPTISLQNKTVVPTTTDQTIEKDSGYDGLGVVTVEAIETETRNETAGTVAKLIDPSPGKYISLITINPTPSQISEITSNGTYSPDSGKYFSQVLVNVPGPALTGDAEVSNVLSGKTFYNNNLEKKTGTLPTYSGEIHVTENHELATAGKYVTDNIVVNVPNPSTGFIDITENANNIDVSSLASVNVNVVPRLQGKEVYTNGLVNPDEGYDGLSGVMVSVPITTNPLTASTDQAMTALITASNNGKVVEFTGTTGTYENGRLYLIQAQ